MDASIIFYIFTAVFGLVIGSFLNVIIYRFHSGFGMHGRSKCLSCSKYLKAYMLIPLFSFLLQRGRCAYCRTKLSWQYPLVELGTSLLFLASAYVNHVTDVPFSPHVFSIFILHCAIWSILMLVMVYDVRHKIIPDRLSLIFALLAGLTLFLKSHWSMIPLPYIPVLNSVPSWIHLVAAPVLAVPLALLWLFSGGRAMGLGDAKLAWGMGWFLGFSKGITAVMFAFWTAFIPSVILLLLPKKHFTMKSEIPFAPFLILGTLIAYLSHFDIVSWTL